MRFSHSARFWVDAARPRLGRAFRTAPVSRQTNTNRVWHSPRFHSRPATLPRPPFKSAAEAAVLIFPTLYAMSGGLILQWMLGYNFSVAVWVGYIALFGIAVETGVVMVVYPTRRFRQSAARQGNRRRLRSAHLVEAAGTPTLPRKDSLLVAPCAPLLGQLNRAGGCF